MRKNRSEVVSITEGSFIGETLVASLSATVNVSQGDTNVTMHVRNKDLYSSNKTEIDKDMDDFRNEVFSRE